MEEEWFALDDDDQVDEVQRAVIDVLRARACGNSWPLDPRDACVALPYHASYGYPVPPGAPPFGHLLAYMELIDPEQNVALLTVGTYFDGSGVRGDRLHNQLLTLPAEPTPLALAAVGPPNEMADRAADWFEALLRRAIVRHEWLRSKEVYALRWLFADSGHALVEGRARTNQLGPPDRVIHVRGDLL